MAQFIVTGHRNSFRHIGHSDVRVLPRPFPFGLAAMTHHLAPLLLSGRAREMTPSTAKEQKAIRANVRHSAARYRNDRRKIPPGRDRAIERGSCSFAIVIEARQSSQTGKPDVQQGVLPN
jgi:hypothetical protein